MALHVDAFKGATPVVFMRYIYLQVLALRFFTLTGCTVNCNFNAVLNP